MKYEGYKIGPVIRDIRKDKGLLIEEVAAGLSTLFQTNFFRLFFRYCTGV